MAFDHHDMAVGYDLTSPALLEKRGLRMIQLQPSRRCNLACKHCYSESGPSQVSELSFLDLKKFLFEAFDSGYEYIGFSGGEPLLWNDLECTLEYCRTLGYETSVSSNATLMTPEKAARLKGLAQLVAVSVDGPPEEHAAMRNSETAFEAMLRGLEALRSAGVRFTIAFTFTQYNAGQLSWLYRFATEQGAAGIHVHPLFSYGSAKGVLDDAVPDSYEFRVASWLLALLVQNHGPGGPAVTFDVMHREKVRQSHWFSLLNECDTTGSFSFSDILPSIIVEPDGCMVPFIYGFPRHWALGSIRAEAFQQQCDAWFKQHFHDLGQIANEALTNLDASNAELCDFFSELHRTATLKW